MIFNIHVLLIYFITIKYSNLCYLYTVNIFVFLHIAKYCELCDEKAKLYIMLYVFSKYI